MASGGVLVRNQQQTNGINTPIAPSTLFGDPSTFSAAARTQGSDYDKIMADYNNIIKSSESNPIKANPVPISRVESAPQVRYQQVNPQLSNYRQSEDVTGSLANLSNLATTGGYSEGDIQNIRERNLSPIRSIYANARENVNRQRALSGGYSPNFNAVQGKMARDEASQIGDYTTKTNADIAQNVVSNRLAAASPYASASANANAAQTAADRVNADIVNQVNMANSQGNNQTAQFNTSVQNAIAEGNANRATNTSQFNTQASLDAAKTNKGVTQNAIAGKASLYGTTPALTNTFGNQVAQAAQLGQGQQQLNNQRFNTIPGLVRFGAG